MEHLLTEARNPASTDLDRLTPLELVRLMNAEDGRVISAVASQAEAIARAIEVTADRLRDGGRLVYAGAGTSGRLGVLDATEWRPTFNTPPGLAVGVIAGGLPALTSAVEGAEDQPELAQADLAAIGLGARDVLVGIAASGRTPYVCAALSYARSLGAFTIGLACTPDADLLPLCDLGITPLVGPEVLTGSTRLKAGTATKLVLNTLSTGVMVRLGKTHGNLMVDLRATNSKLRARANRIVRHFTGLSVEAADELLGRCDGEVKTAIVAHGASLSAAEARARLEAVGGQVRLALEGPAPPPTQAADLILGIDGGGTHTVAMLATLEPGGARFAGRGEAGPSNLHAVGPDRALAALDEAVSAAFRDARRQRGSVRSACLGLAGAGRPEERAVFKEWAARVSLGASVMVVDDAVLLLAAGTSEGWGVALVAGTGSIAWGRTAEGRTARAGGWGPLLGDQGSGYVLALDALRAVARDADGHGIPTRLTGALLAHLGLRRPQELIGHIHQRMDRAAVSALAPVVLAVAEEGDMVAGHIVEGGASILAETASAVVDALGMEGQPVPFALAGGLLVESAYYRELVLASLESYEVRAEPIKLVDEPVDGAVRLALATVVAESAQ